MTGHGEEDLFSFIVEDSCSVLSSAIGDCVCCGGDYIVCWCVCDFGEGQQVLGVGVLVPFHVLCGGFLVTHHECCRVISAGIEHPISRYSYVLLYIFF